MCYCKQEGLDPKNFCNPHDDIQHDQEEEEELMIGFIFLLGVAFMCTFLLYIYNRIEALEIIPESIAAIILGIIIGILLKY